MTRDMRAVNLTMFDTHKYTHTSRMPLTVQEAMEDELCAVDQKEDHLADLSRFIYFLLSNAYVC